MLKKRITSMLLVVSMLMGLSAQVFATEQEIPTESKSVFVMQDADGNKMEFSIKELENGSYLMSYFSNGVLETEYIFDGSQYIIERHTNGTESTFDATKYVQVDPIETYSTKTVQKDFCTIKYKYSSYFDYTPTADIDYVCKTTQKTVNVTAEKQAKFSKVVASCVNILIGLFAPQLFTAAGFSNIASGVISTALAAIGGKVVDDTITKSLSEDFNCKIETYDYKIEMDILGTVKSVTYKNAGEIFEMYYEADDHWTHDIKEIPPERARELPATFAKTIWNETFVASYPGYSSCTFV